MLSTARTSVCDCSDYIAMHFSTFFLSFVLSARVTHSFVGYRWSVCVCFSSLLIMQQINLSPIWIMNMFHGVESDWNERGRIELFGTKWREIFGCKKLQEFSFKVRKFNWTVRNCFLGGFWVLFWNFYLFYFFIQIWIKFDF